MRKTKAGRVLACCLALLVGLGSGCQPKPAESSNPSSTPGKEEEMEKPFVIPTIDPAACNEQTASGIITLMREINATYVSLGEESQAQETAARDARWQALKPLLENPVNLTSRGAADGGDITALLQTALSEGEQGVAVYLPAGRYTLSADVTIPEKAVLVFEAGALLQLGTHTLTIEGYLEAPYTVQIFEGGTVVCRQASQPGYPQWFGAAGDGRQDDTAALQACVDAFSTTVLPYTGTNYRLSTIRVGADRVIRGEGGYKTGIMAIDGIDTLFSIDGSHVDISGLHLTLLGMARDGTAFLLNNADRELEDIHLHQINSDRGPHFVSDTGSGKPITHVRLFEIDCRDASTISYYFRDVSAFLYLEHCIIDYAQAVAIHHETIDFPSFYVENCVGVLMENCDPLGGYKKDGSGGHGYVFRNCAAVYLNRGYADTLNGYGYWFDNVSFSQVVNSGGGLNGSTGLLLENCKGIAFDLFQMYGRRALQDNQADGIVIRNCENLTFTNLQSFWHIGNALIIEDSSGIVINSYTAYENAGAGFIERGSSNHNLVNGYVNSDCPDGDVLLGASSGFYSLVKSDRAQPNLTNARTQETVGAYTAFDTAVPNFEGVPISTVSAAFDAAVAEYQTLHAALEAARKMETSSEIDALERALSALYVQQGSVNVKTLGAVGDGKTDDLQAFAAALKKGGTVAVPAGTYLISDNLSVEKGTQLCLEPGAVLQIKAGKRLSVNGLLLAGSYTLFSGDGSVGGTPQNTYGYPQWLGAAGDGIANDTDAFAQALTLFREVRVPYTSGGYLLDGLTLPGKTTIKGVGASYPMLRSSDAKAKFLTFREKNVLLTNLELDMSKTTKGSIALFFDNAAENISMFFMKNLVVRSPHKTVSDCRTGNETLIHNVYFDNMQILAPQDTTFYYGDFFGFIFMRDVVVDYQGVVTHVPAVQVDTNYGLIMEDCVVRGAGEGSTGDAYVLANCWDVWSMNCRAEDIGGRGFVFKDMHHCFFTGLTAVNCKGEGVLFQSQYDQYHDIRVKNTAGIRFEGAYYLNVTGMKATGTAGNGIALGKSGFCNGYDMEVSGSQENDLFEGADCFYNVLTRFAAAKTSLSGLDGLRRP